MDTNYNINDIYNVMYDILNLTSISTSFFKRSNAYLRGKIRQSQGTKLNANDALVTKELFYHIADTLINNQLNFYSNYDSYESYKADLDKRVSNIRSYISLSYFNEQYIRISPHTYRSKLAAAFHGEGKYLHLSDKETELFNYGLIQLASVLAWINPVMEECNNAKELQNILFDRRRKGVRSKASMQEINKPTRIAVCDASKLLGFPLRTMYHKIHTGEIPSKNVNGRYILDRAEITHWGITNNILKEEKHEED